MAEQQDTVLPETVAQMVGHCDRIRDHLLHRHRLGWNIGRERHPRSALLPPDHREMPLEPGRVAVLHEELRHPWTAVEEQEHRVRGVDALDEHALRNAADLDAHALRQASGDDVAVAVAERRGATGAVGEEVGSSTREDRRE